MKLAIILTAALLAGCASPQMIQSGAGVACTTFDAMLYGKVTTVYISIDKTSGDIVVGPGCVVEIVYKR